MGRFSDSSAEASAMTLSLHRAGSPGLAEVRYLGDYPFVRKMNLMVRALVVEGGKKNAEG
jgi:hypothetical protein